MRNIVWKKNNGANNIYIYIYESVQNGTPAWKTNDCNDKKKKTVCYLIKFTTIIIISVLRLILANGK